MEFLMCIGIDPNIIGRMGLVAITFLPPLGILLTSYICDLKHWINWSGIVFAVGLSIFYSVVPDAFTELTCNPFYATYSYPLGNVYGIFYFGYIAWAFILIIIAAIRNKSQSRTALNKKGIYVLIGYLSFLIPMGLTILIDYTTLSALESIMCKYAILLAVTLFLFSFQYERNEKKDQKIVIG
jgi:hypothetical protein